MDVLDYFGLELAKIAADDSLSHPAKIPLLSLLGQTGVGVAALKALGRSTEKDQKAIDAIEAKLKAKGVERGEYGSPAYITKRKNLTTSQAEQLKRMGLKPNSVIGPKNMSLDALAHEAGHATGNKVMHNTRAYQASKLMMIPSLLGTGVGIHRATRDKGNMSKEERLKAIREGQAITGISAASQAPMVAEEARATARGARMVARKAGMKRIPKYLGRTGLAFGTYAAIPAGSVYAIKKMQDQKKKIRGKSKKTPSTKITARRVQG